MGGVLPALTGVPQEPARSAVSRPALVGVAPPPPVLDALPPPAMGRLLRQRVRGGIFPTPTALATSPPAGLLFTGRAGAAAPPGARS